MPGAQHPLNAPTGRGAFWTPRFPHATGATAGPDNLPLSALDIGPFAHGQTAEDAAAFRDWLSAAIVDCEAWRVRAARWSNSSK